MGYPRRGIGRCSVLEQWIYLEDAKDDETDTGNHYQSHRSRYQLSGLKGSVKPASQSQSADTDYGKRQRHQPTEPPEGILTNEVLGRVQLPLNEVQDDKGPHEVGDAGNPYSSKYPGEYQPAAHWLGGSRHTTSLE